MIYKKKYDNEERNKERKKETGEWFYERKEIG